MGVEPFPSLAVQPTAHRFTVEVETDWSLAAPQWKAAIDGAAVTPFQAFDWLDAWYRSIAPAVGVAPKLVTVRDQVSGGLVMMLPLVTISSDSGRTLAFADLELSDFNAPLLGPVAVEPGQERALWQAITAALPGHDVADFRKMPAVVQGRVNPFVALTGAQMSGVASNALALVGTFADFHGRLERRVRMELERCWRVLNREAAVVFEPVVSLERAHVVLDAMDRQQRDRLTEGGSTFVLDQPPQSALYRHNLAERLAAGSVQLTCITVGGEIVAALYAVADGHTAVVLRIANAGKAWSRVSPGRLIVHKSIEHFYARGLKVCDLSIGDYDYKRRFGVVRTPLVDLVAALSWRGRMRATRHWAVGTLREHPTLDRRVRGLFQSWSSGSRTVAASQKAD